MSPRKKSKTHQTNISDAFFGSNEKQKKECMFRHYKGKRILLKATDIYGKNKVPKGEEAYNFQYIVTDVSDETYATIEFEGKYIKDDTEEFKSYPAIDEDDFMMDNYRLSCLKDDHALFNKYRGVVNKKINDAAQAQRDSEAAEKQSSLDDYSDIQYKIMQNHKIDKFELLILEFEPVGDRKTYTIEQGPHTGKQAEKQVWSKSTSYSFAIIYNLNLLLT
jgi:hypothetical protein